MKWFHNATVGKCLVVGFAVAVHGVFALGAYYLGLFISNVILSDVSWLVQPAAILFALLTFAGAMWGFIYMEYAHEDVVAYSRMTGKGYKRYLVIVQMAIAGDELASLAFRCYQVNNAFERCVVASVGVLFLVIAFCLGKVIHAMANRPFEVSVRRAQQEAGRSLIDDALAHIKAMTAEQKARFYAGDPSVIDEVRRVKEERLTEQEIRKQEQEQERQERERQEREEHAGARTFTSNLLNFRHRGGASASTNDPPFPNAQAN